MFLGTKIKKKIPSFLEKSKILLFFKFLFFYKKFWKFVYLLSIRVSPIKKTKFAINASGKSAKVFEISLRVLWGKLNLDPPSPYVESNREKADTWWNPTLRALKNPLKHQFSMPQIALKNRPSSRTNRKSTFSVSELCWCWLADISTNHMTRSRGMLLVLKVPLCLIYYKLNALSRCSL